jgi:hypothetical protein
MENIVAAERMVGSNANIQTEVRNLQIPALPSPVRDSLENYDLLENSHANAMLGDFKKPSK